MTIMDIYRNTLYETNELSKYISLTKHIKNGTKLFFIKMRLVSNKYYFQININNESTKFDIQYLDRKNYLINIPTVKESLYYFYVNTTNIYDNTLYFDTLQDSLDNIVLYYYFFKTFDIYQINLELAKRKYDTYENMHYSKYYEASISNDTKCMIIMAFPKINYTNFYFKVIYHDWLPITSFKEQDLKISQKQYIILKYDSSIYFKEENNSLISVMIDNGTDDFYVGLYSKINDIYPEEMKNNSGNLINGSYINFNYVNGDKYIFVSNFKHDLKYSKIKIINNKEYYKISQEIYFSYHHNYTSLFKFNKTLNQILTLSFVPYENGTYLCFKFNSPNLKLQINAFTDNGVIKPVQNYCFKNDYKKIFFELMASSEKEFDEFRFTVQLQKELEILEPENSINVLAIIIPIIAIILLIIAIIIVIIFKRKKINNKNTSYCSSDLNRNKDFETSYNSNDINQQNMYGQNNINSIELNQMPNNNQTPYNNYEINGNNNINSFPEYEKPYYS